MASFLDKISPAKLKKYSNMGVEALQRAIENHLKKKFTKRARPVAGRMYLYSYDALYKDVLPIWDALPLIIFMDFRTNGFTGLNVHYISFMNKRRLLKKLESIARDDKVVGGKKVLLSYKMIKGFSSVKDIETGFKRYRFDRLRSQFIEIPYDDWKYIVYLPIAKWHKKKK